MDDFGVFGAVPGGIAVGCGACAGGIGLWEAFPEVGRRFLFVVQDGEIVGGVGGFGGVGGLLAGELALGGIGAYAGRICGRFGWGGSGGWGGAGFWLLEVGREQDGLAGLVSQVAWVGGLLGALGLRSWDGGEGIELAAKEVDFVLEGLYGGVQVGDIGAFLLQLLFEVLDLGSELFVWGI